MVHQIQNVVPINAEFLLQGMNKGQSLSFQICVQNLFLLY